MPIKELRPDLAKKLQKYSLQKKFAKAVALFQSDSRHPSLHTEILKPSEFGVYSFRIDRKFRVHFIVVSGEVEIIDITVHYQ